MRVFPTLLCLLVANAALGADKDVICTYPEPIQGTTTPACTENYFTETLQMLTDLDSMGDGAAPDEIREPSQKLVLVQDGTQGAINASFKTAPAPGLTPSESSVIENLNENHTKLYDFFVTGSTLIFTNNSEDDLEVDGILIPKGQSQKMHALNGTVKKLDFEKTLGDPPVAARAYYEVRFKVRGIKRAGGAAPTASPLATPSVLPAAATALPSGNPAPSSLPSPSTAVTVIPAPSVQPSPSTDSVYFSVPWH